MIARRTSWHGVFAALIALAMTASSCSGGSDGHRADLANAPGEDITTTSSSSAVVPAATSDVAPSPTSSTGPEVAKGRTDVSVTIGGDERHFIVDVPSGYRPGTPAPLVMMLHGSGGTVEGAWENSGWKELGETENVVTVFPQAWTHCWINSTGITRTETVWNSYPGPFTLCDGETPRNDVAFLRLILDRVSSTLDIDASRVYLVGFSSGGRMAFRAAVELGDMLAAVVQVAGTNQIENVGPDPVRNLPIAFEVGNDDETWLPGKTGLPLDNLEYSLTRYPWFGLIVSTHLATFDFSPQHVLVGDVDSAMSAVYPGVDGPGREFVFSVINDLGHEYPNGVNHPIVGADRHWRWMSRFTLP